MLAGVAFRDAHARVGALVRQSMERNVSLAELVATDPDLGPEAARMLEPGAAARARTTPGGASPGPVAVQLEAARARLDDQAVWLDE